MAADVVATIDDLKALRPVAQPIPLNNTALEFLRHSLEAPPGFPTVVDGVDLTPHDLVEIMTLGRGKGTAFWFEEPPQPWSWRQMFAAMNDATLERLIGDHTHGGGVASITFQYLRHSYDHKREHAAQEELRPYADGAPVPIWEFVVKRSNGTAMRFHPDQKGKKFGMSKFENAPPSEGPARGRGLSDGPGTYRRFINYSWDEHGVFDFRNVRGGGGGKGKGKGNGASTVVEPSAMPAIMDEPSAGAASSGASWTRAVNLSPVDTSTVVSPPASVASTVIHLAGPPALEPSPVGSSTVVESPAMQVPTVAQTAPVGTAVDQGKVNGDDGNCEGQGDNGYNASTVVEPPGTQVSTAAQTAPVGTAVDQGKGEGKGEPGTSVAGQAQGQPQRQRQGQGQWQQGWGGWHAWGEGSAQQGALPHPQQPPQSQGRRLQGRREWSAWQGWSY